MTAPEITNATERPAVEAPVERRVRPRAWALPIASMAGDGDYLRSTPSLPNNGDPPMKWEPLYALDVERMAAALYEHIKHGDDAHREWLRVQSLAWVRGYFGA